LKYLFDNSFEKISFAPVRSGQRPWRMVSPKEKTLKNSSGNSVFKGIITLLGTTMYLVNNIQLGLKGYGPG
jgi:hypothetical protein